MYLSQMQFTYNHRNQTKDLFHHFMSNAITCEKCMLNYQPIEEPIKIAYIPRKTKDKKKIKPCVKCQLPKKQRA
jgi:hypothetical protein